VVAGGVDGGSGWEANGSCNWLATTVLGVISYLFNDRTNDCYPEYSSCSS